MLDQDKIKSVQNSYGRCLGEGDVVDSFYTIFLESHPDVKSKFSKTDFVEQKKLLRHGISLMIMYASDNFVGKNGLERIQDSHSKGKLDIDPRFYSYWKESLLKAVEKHDKLFDEHIEKNWQVVLDTGIEFIKKGY